ncbi:hypothetical protein [Avibacterium avium]|uniref:hypothetical protein n=1 Tax=Avibacterium avium TaxID=751 RepID=UPI0039FC0E1E
MIALIKNIFNGILNRKTIASNRLIIVNSTSSKIESYFNSLIAEIKIRGGSKGYVTSSDYRELQQKVRKTIIFTPDERSILNSVESIRLCKSSSIIIPDKGHHMYTVPYIVDDLKSEWNEMKFILDNMASDLAKRAGYTK